jgi:RNA polymerase sigma-70 factor (ECF subfamily)
MSGGFSEKLLLYRLRTKNDPESYAKLYDAYVEQIYRFVYFKVSSKEEAEDITSEVFLKAWHFVQEKKEITSFRGLLYRIARNCIIDLYRKKSAKPEAYLDDQLEAGLEVGDKGKWFKDISTKLESEKILEALKKLKQEYQEVITLRYVDELEIEEIAEIIGKGKVTVRVTIHRALNKLQQILKKE